MPSAWPGRAVAHAVFVLSLLFAAASARAQCSGQWIGGDLAHGVDDPVFAMVNWDQDGAGPLPPLLAVAGYFKAAGDTAASGIALWNPATWRWSALSSEISIDNASDKVYALAVNAPDCLNADLDGDADVDQSDCGIFQRCYSGTDTPADPDCAN